MTDSLTGVWDGSFIQPGVGPVMFLATLIETGSALTGSVTEPCMSPGCPIDTHDASIAGQRSGGAVSFVKRYEPPGYGYAHVFYEGSVNADATEIDGRWKLPDNSAAGTFLMIRSGRPAQAVAIDESTRVPAR
jgi:hypothetical protein